MACVFAVKSCIVNFFSVAVIASMKSSIGITFVSILARSVCVHCLASTVSIEFDMPLLVADCREAQYQDIFCNFQICTSSLEDCSAIFTRQLL